MEDLKEEMERFLNKEMSPEEYADFKEKLAADEALMETFKEHVLMKKAGNTLIREKAEIKGQEGLEEYRKTKKEQLDKPNKQIWWLFAIGLGAILLSAAYFFFNDKSQPKTPPIPAGILAKNNYLDNNKVEDILVQPLESLSEGDSIIQVSLRFLREKNYENAINSIDELPNSNTDYMRMQVIQGLCFLKQGNSSAAIQKFDKIKTENIYLQEEAEWLKAIAFLSSDDYSKEQKAEVLDLIRKNKNHKYQKDAEEFLGLLD